MFVDFGPRKKYRAVLLPGQTVDKTLLVSTPEAFFLFSVPDFAGQLIALNVPGLPPSNFKLPYMKCNFWKNRI